MAKGLVTSMADAIKVATHIDDGLGSCAKTFVGNIMIVRYGPKTERLTVYVDGKELEGLFTASELAEFIIWPNRKVVNQALRDARVRSIK